MSVNSKIKTLCIKFFQSNIVVYILSLLGAFIGFGLNIFLSRIVNLEQLDKIKYLVALCTTISNLLVIGLPSFIIRESNNSEQKGLLMSKCLSIYFYISVLATPIVYWAISNFTVYTRDSKYLSICVLLVSFLLGLFSLFTSELYGRKHFNRAHLFETIVPKGIILALLFAFFVLQKTRVLDSVYLIFYLLIYSAFSIVFVIREFKGIRINFSKKEVVTLLFLWGTTVAQVLSSNLSTVLQSNLFPDIVGVTSTISSCTLLFSAIGVFTNVISSIAKPIFASYSRENNLKAIRETFEFTTRFNLYISIPIYLFFMIFPAKFLAIFGENLTKYPMIMTILALANCFSSICGTTGAMLTMIGHEKKQLYNTAIQLLSFVAIAFLFRNNSVYGLVIASALAEVIITVIKFTEVSIIFKRFPFNLKTIISLLIEILTNGAIISLFSLIKIGNLFVWFLFAVLTGMVVLVLNFVLLPNAKKDLRKVLTIK